jgi:hypothetical protein
MKDPAYLTNFVELSVILIETQRKAAIVTTYQSGQDARKLEQWLDMPQQRFVMLGIDLDSLIQCRVLSGILAMKLSRPLNNWWLNRRLHGNIRNSFESLVTSIRKKSMLPNIRDDAINSMIGHAQNTLRYTYYTWQFNDFLRRS